MRNQVYKKQHPKWESNFSVLTEIDEAELELEGVTEVIDFTSTIFSVHDQSHLHLICRGEAGRTELRQIFVEQTFPGDDKFLGKIDLIETKVQEVQINDALRIFQVDTDIFVLASQTLTRISFTDLEVVETTELPVEHH